MGVTYEHFILPVERGLLPKAERIASLVERLRHDGWVMTPSVFHAAREAASQEEDLDDAEPPDESGVTYDLAEAQAAETRSREARELYYLGRAQVCRRNPSHPRSGRPLFEPIPSPLTPAWIDAQRRSLADPRPIAREMCLSFPVDVPDAFATYVEAGMRYPFTFGGNDPSNSHVLEIHFADDFVSGCAPNAFDSISDLCACGEKLGYEARAVTDNELVLGIHDWWTRIKRSCPRCGAAFDPKARSSSVRNGWTGETREIHGGVVYRFAIHIDCGKAWPREGGPIALAPDLRRLVEAEIGMPFEDVGGLD